MHYQKSKKMIKKNVTLIFIVINSVFFVQCAKEGEFATPNSYSNTPQGNFDAFWHGINQNYLFFEYTDVNWQREYDINKPKITSSTTRQQLTAICKSMFDKLIDGHRELKIPAYRITNQNGNSEEVDAQNIGVDISKMFKENPFTYTDSVIIENYMADNPKIVIGQSPQSGEDDVEIMYAKLQNKNIAYCKLFYFGDALFTNMASADVQNFATFIKQAQRNKSTLIIDLRLNTGGFVASFAAFCGIFVDKPYICGYSKVKLGMGNTDMSPFIPETIQASNLGYFSNKVVIITNKFSISSSEITCMALKELPNVTVIGEQTFGANGPISEQKEFTGNFTMPNGWQVQLAQRITYDKNKNIYEGKGVPPDIFVKQNINAASNGIDNQLEEAINFLETNP